MSTTIRNNVLAGFCFFAFLFVAAVGIVDAQADNPIDDDDILASVTIGDEVWATPVALKSELEVATGKQATIESARQLLDRLPPASATNSIRFEGGYPSGSVSQDLDSLGYVTSIHVSTPSVVGATVAVIRAL